MCGCGRVFVCVCVVCEGERKRERECVCVGGGGIYLSYTSYAGTGKLYTDVCLCCSAHTSGCVVDGLGATAAF